MRLGLPAATTLMIVVALSNSACRSERNREKADPVSSSKPSMADLLASGGIYPIVVPLGWKLVDANGKDESIPQIPGSTFHRIMGKGALLAKEDRASPDQPEVMMFTALHSPAPITSEMLDRYAEQVVKNLTGKSLAPRVEEKRLFQRTGSDELRGKLVVSRQPSADGLMEIHYLLSDQKRETWELVYLIRRENLERWRTLLAEIE